MATEMEREAEKALFIAGMIMSLLGAIGSAILTSLTVKKILEGA